MANPKIIVCVLAALSTVALAQDDGAMSIQIMGGMDEPLISPAPEPLIISAAPEPEPVSAPAGNVININVGRWSDLGKWKDLAQLPMPTWLQSALQSASNSAVQIPIDAAQNGETSSRPGYDEFGQPQVVPDEEVVEAPKEPTIVVVGDETNQQVQPAVQVQPTPQVQYLQPAPRVQYLQPTPQVQYLQPTPQVQYLQPTPQVQYLQSTPQVQYLQPAPQVQYLQSSPQVQYLRPASQVQQVQSAPQVQYLRPARQAQLLQPAPLPQYWQ